MPITMHPPLAVHPGDWRKSEIVDPQGVSINRLAASFHVTRQTLKVGTQTTFRRCTLASRLRLTRQ